MDETLKALGIIEGVIVILDDERGTDEKPRIAAAIGALGMACELLGEHVDSLENCVSIAAQTSK